MMWRVRSPGTSVGWDNQSQVELRCDAFNVGNLNLSFPIWSTVQVSIRWILITPTLTPSS